MVILAYPYGNHSNRLLQNLHFEAFCKEYNVEYINPSFFDMHKYYVRPCKWNKGLKGIVFMSRYLRKLAKIMIKLKLLKSVKIFDTEVNSCNYVETLLVPYDIYVGGWNFRVEDLVEKYQDYFIEKYTLKEKYIKNNKLLDLINTLKKNGKTIIGVHIRRGDYKIWENGKYYFDDDVYKKYMDTLTNKIINCCFIIFTNENVLINENEYIYKSNNQWYVDHFLMSKCDFLIGPPSTFTMWASYIGKVKYYHIKDNSGIIDVNDFYEL